MRKLRITLAAVFFVGITLLLVGIGQQWWGWMAKLQFLPSCFAINFAVIAATLLITLALGRLYCSIICPLGVLQDLSLKLHRKKRFTPSRERRWLRFTVLALSVASVLVFGQVGIALIAPYSAYGRIVAAVCSLLVGSTSLALLVVGIVTLVLIALLAFFFGRAWCNNICPVGTLLSAVSRWSLWRPVIDESKCVSCGVCAKRCRSACIDPKEHKVDMSRCVVCFDCLDNCKVGAIQYKFVGFNANPNASQASKSSNKASCTAANSGTIKGDNQRRNFLTTGTLLLSSALSLKAQNLRNKAQESGVVKNLDGGLAEITPKCAPQRAERIVPAGSGSVKDFYSRCTACQLCVQNCPQQVLQPSTDLEHLLQPQMDFSKGYCRLECNICSTLCPSGAIRNIDLAEKSRTKIATAKLNLELCLAAKGEEGCGNCARHCPTGALRMLQAEEYTRKIPVVNEELCIGCGACEHLCPSRPISAISLDGLSVHRSQ